jgi:hypothetical protein
MSDETPKDRPEQTADNACGCEDIHFAAAEAVRLAKLEFEKAQKYYDDLCSQAAEKIKEVRETTVGDLIDKTLVKVKKYPGLSLIVSASLGFCLGRKVQRFFKK